MTASNRFFSLFHNLRARKTQKHKKISILLAFSSKNICKMLFCAITLQHDKSNRTQKCIKALLIKDHIQNNINSKEIS